MSDMDWFLFSGLAMTVLGSLASLCLKMASSSRSLEALLRNRNFYLGAFLYLMSAVINIRLLKVYDYSLVLPMTSVTYVWTAILGRLILMERIPARTVAGLLLIVGGTMMLVAGA